MRLDSIKGLHRASLCLAVGYYNINSVGRFDKTVRVVTEFLHNNGLKFDYSVLANKMMVKKTVELAEEVVLGKIELARAIEKLEEYLF